MSVNVSIVQFLGSNCDHDTEFAFENLGAKTTLVWYQETKLPENTDLVVIPGGFSYGDYLRCGAIARFAPIMNDVIAYANRGGKVLGICNGFQILLEAGLLPGAMRRNKNLHFISKFHHLKVASKENTFLSKLNVGDIVNIPIAHAEGNYYIDDEGLSELKANDQILLTYCDEDGNVCNPNGSVADIAGISNKNKNVFGLMPHPERAIDAILNSDDGVKMLKGFFKL